MAYRITNRHSDKVKEMLDKLQSRDRNEAESAFQVIENDPWTNLFRYKEYGPRQNSNMFNISRKIYVSSNRVEILYDIDFVAQCVTIIYVRKRSKVIRLIEEIG